MPDSRGRTQATKTRREGRRSLAAYESRSRASLGTDDLERGVTGARQSTAGADSRSSHGMTQRVRERARAVWPPFEGAHAAVPGQVGAVHGLGAGDWCAGIAFALVFPLIRADRARARQVPPSSKGRGERGTCMKRKPSIRSLETVSLEEARAYLEYAAGDEIDAAFALATDRNRLDGSQSVPDDAEVHHALFLLCRARGKDAPSFDDVRVELRRRVAA